MPFHSFGLLLYSSGKLSGWAFSQSQPSCFKLPCVLLRVFRWGMVRWGIEAHKAVR